MHPCEKRSLRCLRGKLVLLALAAGCAGSGAALAQGAAPEAEAAAARMEKARLADVDTVFALTQDGAILYSQDELKMSGYQYCSQAMALADAGDFRQSVRAASKALHLANSTRDPQLQAYANRDLAIVFSYSGQLEKAEQFARDALRTPVKDPHQVVGPANKVIGDVQTRRGDYAAAVLSYEAALAGSSERYKPLVQTSLVNALAEAGQYKRAREVLDTIVQPKDASLAAQLDRTQARLLLAENNAEMARELYREQTTQKAGIDASYYRMWAWDGVARAEMLLGNKQAAATASTQALDAVDSVRARFRSEEFKMGLFSDVQAIFDRAIGLYTELGDNGRALEVSERSRSRALLDSVRGRAGGATLSTAAPELSAMQRVLRPDERVLEFHSLPDRLQVWVIGPAGVQAHAIPIKRDELGDLVDGYRESVVRGRRAAITNAERLGAALIGPLGLADGQRLVVVPHGPLHYLPFQALRVNGRYLIETHPVSVVPSMGIALQLAQRPGAAPADLVAFGNPAIEQKYDLPGSEAEVKQLARLFPRNEVFIGAQANKTRFRQAVADAPIVHVAAHAEADQVDPLYSRILLANEGGRQNFLEAHEILGMKMSNTALVTLSACESGLGRIARGDEVLGFPRSFLMAGAGAMIASLWPVSDDATELLMSTFYSELAKGRDTQRAMQAAQLAVLRDPKLAHPFFWAPFNLIGNWRMTVGGSAA